MSSSANGDFKSPYGTIHVRNPGPFEAYANVEVYKQNKTGTRIVKLQRPAIRAFKAAEARCATARKPHILITGIGYRSYSDQRILWLGDSQRFADPDLSMHVEADAVDVDQGQGTRRLKAIHRALIAEGWYQAVENEPWHYSFRIAG